MRIFTALLGLLLSVALTAQVRVVPLAENATLHTEQQRRDARLNAEVSALLQRTWTPQTAATTNREGCRIDNFDTRYAEAGTEVLFILVDTLGSANGGDGALVLTECAAPSDLGTVAFFENSDTLAYTFDPNVTAGTDTVCVELCDGNGENCALFRYPIVLRRTGNFYDEGVEAIAEDGATVRCVDLGLLPAPIECVRLIDNPDNAYEGTDSRIVYLETYTEPSACIVYKAGAIPGDDVVYYEVCDEFKICDTFSLTFRVDTENFGPLPFFDDFSYAGPYPSRTYWLDRDVFVNRTLSDFAPSVGMASFDGLDPGGSPYDNFRDHADRLTSRPVDLSDFDGNDGVFLKYFVSRKGLGNPPNALDSLQLEFRTADGDWEVVESYAGYQSPPGLLQSDSFDYQVVGIAQSRFLHADFQFRFVNQVTSDGGYEDLWHVDYVRLAAGEGNDPVFPDVAFTEPPSKLLARYSQMPYAQFVDHADDEVGESFRVELFNHFGQAQNLDDSAIRVRETTTNEALGSPLVTVADADNLDSRAFFVAERENPSRAALIDFMEDFEDLEKPTFELEYSFSLAEQPAEFLRNDTVTSITCFGDVFAYDDGTAELALYLQNGQGSNPELAVRYTANVADTLRGIQFHFPRVNGDVSQQLFNIKVWVGELNDEPAYNAIFERPLYVDEPFDTLQGFTTYVLENALGEPTPVVLPAGTDFYIGWQQVSTVGLGVPVGYDLNNPSNAFTFVRVGLDWEPFVYDGDGSLMMRAVLGSDPPAETTSTDEPATRAELNFRVAPNPTDGPLRLQLHEPNPQDFRLQLVNALGQVVYRAPFAPTLDLRDLGPGIYYLQLSNSSGSRRVHRKILVQ